MTLTVLWRSSTGSEAAQNLQDLLDSGITLRVETEPEQALEQRGWYKVLVDGNPSEALLDAAGLEHVIVPYVGINSGLRERVLARPRLNLYNSHFNDAYVAQHAVALLLAVANRLVPADRALRRGDWTQAGSARPESLFLEDKMCLLLGYGAIGRAIETRVRGLGMQVSALRRQPDSASPTLRVYGPDELEAALAQADVVMLSLPSTPSTKGLLDAQAIGAMKRSSILVNVGRGDVVDQQALYDALERGQLFGAGLDVWWTYPKDKAGRRSTLPADLPFHDLENVVMSPHRANEVQGWEEASFRDVAATLNALARGESRNRVDPEAGY